MTQWDIYDWKFNHGNHPCVIITNPLLCGNAAVDTVNILACSSHRSQRHPKDHEVLLDSADGMDWETICRVDRIFLVPKTELTRRRGSLTSARRQQIGAKIIRVFGLWRP